jgi:hypothetical protein
VANRLAMRIFGIAAVREGTVVAVLLRAMAMSRHSQRKARCAVGVGVGAAGCGSMKAWHAGQQQGTEGISSLRGA